MMNLKNHINRYPKMLYAGVALVAVTGFIAVAVYGTLWKGEVKNDGGTIAVELTHEGGHGDELAEEAYGHEGDHHNVVVTPEHETEAGELLEITLNAVEGLAWRFEPSVVEVPVGHRVKLTLVNNGRVEHDVEVGGIPAEDIEVVDLVDRHVRLGGGHHPEGVVAVHAEPGTSTSVMFTATEVGEYEFACTIPGHKAAGMVGKLVVTE